MAANMDFETILYVPQKAWERIHNEDGDEYLHEAKLNYETYSNKAGWEN